MMPKTEGSFIKYGTVVYVKSIWLLNLSRHQSLNHIAKCSFCGGKGSRNGEDSRLRSLCNNKIGCKCVSCVSCLNGTLPHTPSMVYKKHAYIRNIALCKGFEALHLSFMDDWYR